MTAVRPATARTLLRRALRELREQHGLTIGQVAHQMEWSVSKGDRIEAGTVSVSVSELRLLLDRYGVRGQRRDELIALGRVARRRPWVRAYADVVSTELLRYLELEAEADEVVQYDPVGAPILLAGPAHLADLARRVPPSVDRRRWVELMSRRRVALLAADGPEVLVVAHADALGTCGDPLVREGVAQVAATGGRAVVIPDEDARWPPPLVAPVTVIRAAGRLLVHWGWIAQGGTVIEDQDAAADVLARVLAMVPDGNRPTMPASGRAGCPQVGCRPQAAGGRVAAGRSGSAR